jgi:hypothetical protein
VPPDHAPDHRYGIRPSSSAPFACQSPAAGRRPARGGGLPGLGENVLFRTPVPRSPHWTPNDARSRRRSRPTNRQARGRNSAVNTQLRLPASKRAVPCSWDLTLEPGSAVPRLGSVRTSRVLAAAPARRPHRNHRWPPLTGCRPTACTPAMASSACRPGHWPGWSGTAFLLAAQAMTLRQSAMSRSPSRPGVAGSVPAVTARWNSMSSSLNGDS